MQTQEDFMKVAIEEAKKAYKKNEVPIGAVIVKDDKIIAKSYNKREKKNDATAHAEILCIKKACKKYKDFRLIGAQLYVTLEPCVMCIGAILNARIEQVYFGAYNNKESAIKVDEIIERAGLNHKCTIYGGIKEQECKNLIQHYFQSKR